MNKSIQIVPCPDTHHGNFDYCFIQQSALYGVFLLILGFFFPAIAIAQSHSGSIKATPNRDHVLIGEQIDLHIEVKTDSATTLTHWVNLADSFNHLEVLSRSRIDTVKNASGTEYHQHITITGFEPGVWTIPELKVALHKKTLKTDSLSITIVPVKLKDSSYHDIRAIIDVPAKNTPRWYWLAGALSAVVLVVLLWLWRKSRVAGPFVFKADAPVTEPYQEAMNKLQQLAKERLAERKEWKQHYSRLTGILKRYMERKFQIPAMQYTTGELLLRLKTRLGNEGMGTITETLRIADAVKFAKYQPAEDQAEISINCMEQTIQLLNQIKL